MAVEPDIRPMHGDHILVIDDDLAIRLLVREILEEGYRTSLATTMLSRDAVKRQEPDLVVLDPMTGGGIRGWRLLEALRLDPETAALPIIVCTGAVRRIREEGQLLAGKETDLVLKPFDLDELVAAVDRLLPRSRGEAGRDGRGPGSDDGRAGSARPKIRSLCAGTMLPPPPDRAHWYPESEPTADPSQEIA